MSWEINLYFWHPLGFMTVSDELGDKLDDERFNVQKEIFEKSQH